MAERRRDRGLEMTDSPVRNKRPVKNDPKCEISRYYIKTDNDRRAITVGLTDTHLFYNAGLNFLNSDY